MAWAKLHIDVLGDVKLIRASRKGVRHLVLLPWLIAFAKQADDGGRLTVGGIPAEPEDIAPLIPDCKPAHVAACATGLASIGVLDTDPDGAYRFAQWSKRSDAYPSDDPAAVRERVRSHRQKQRDNARGNDSHSLQVTSGNESVKRGALARELEGEGEVELEGDEKPRRRNERNDPTWVGEALTIWTQSVGHTTPAKIRKALDAIVTAHTWPVVKAALAIYVSPDEGPPPDKPKKPEWFAENVHRWRTIAETPIDDGRGALTERGRRLAGGTL